MKITVKELVKFAMIAAVMYVSKVAMAWLPNIHIIGTFIVALTIVYRKKALYPIYGYIMIEGALAGFAVWWLPYLYIWGILFIVTYELPKYEDTIKSTVIYVTVLALHGLLFGTLYAIGNAVIYKMDFPATIAWIISGLPFDAIHGFGNCVLGILILRPLVRLFNFCETKLKN